MFLILLLAAAAARGQAPPEAPVFRAGAREVRVDVQVVEDGRLIGGLAQEDFLIFDAGRPQRATHFGRESEPLALLLLLDVSGSMQRSLKAMAARAREALGYLRAGDQVGIMVFRRDARVREDFTQDFARAAAALDAAVKERQPGGGTAINHSVAAAAEYISVRPEAARGRRAILIVTDGGGLNYRLTDEDVLRKFHDASVVLNAIVPGNARPPAPAAPGRYANPDFTPSDIFRLARETGGEALKSDRADTPFLRMLEGIRLRYSLHYLAPEAEPGTFREIRVELSPEARRRHPRAEVRARKGYFAP